MATVTAVRSPLFSVILKAGRQGLFTLSVLDDWQNRLPLLNPTANGSADGDAIASGEGSSLADGTGSAAGDATASGDNASTVFPFAHQSPFDIVRRVKRITVLENFQPPLPVRATQASFGDGDGAASGDAIASSEGSSLADSTGSASGDATASASGDQVVFPFAHQQIFEVARRARRIVTLEQWQNPTLIVRYNSDAAGAASGDAIASSEGSSLFDATASASGDATASAEGSSNVFPFAHQSIFDVVRRARRIVTLEQWQTLATHTTVTFTQAAGSATGDANASAEGSALSDAVGSATGDAISSGVIEGIFDAVGTAQGDSEANARGKADKRVKLVQGVEGGHTFDIAFRHELNHRIDRLHFDANAFQNDAFETLFIQGEIGHIIVDGVPLPTRGTAAFSSKAGSSSFPIKRGRAEF